MKAKDVILVALCCSASENTNKPQPSTLSVTILALKQKKTIFEMVLGNGISKIYLVFYGQAFTVTRGQRYKSFYGHNFQIFTMSLESLSVARCSSQI